MAFKEIKALLLDMGGVLMTNGWDHNLRKKTAAHFNIEYEEMNQRHALIVDIYEIGKLSLDDYLMRTVFFKKRNFSKEEFKQYIFDAVRPFQEMLDFASELKAQTGIKIGILSNEGRELGIDRIKRFNLAVFVDFFIVSGFVHLRKPDPAIYHLAIDLLQVPPSSIAYVDDRPLLTEVGRELGLHAIQYKDVHVVKEAITSFLGASLKSS